MIACATLVSAIRPITANIFINAESINFMACSRSHCVFKTWAPETALNRDPAARDELENKYDCGDDQ